MDAAQLFEMGAGLIYAQVSLDLVGLPFKL